MKDKELKDKYIENYFRRKSRMEEMIDPISGKKFVEIDTKPLITSFFDEFLPKNIEKQEEKDKYYLSLWKSFHLCLFRYYSCNSTILFWRNPIVCVPITHVGINVFVVRHISSKTGGSVDSPSVVNFYKILHTKASDHQDLEKIDKFLFSEGVFTREALLKKTSVCNTAEELFKNMRCCEDMKLSSESLEHFIKNVIYPKVYLHFVETEPFAEQVQIKF